MDDPADYLGWPFFDDSHRALASTVDGVAADLAATAGGSDTDAACRAIVRGLGESGLLRLCIDLDVRSLCLARERLAQTDPLLDFAFAMQGLGSAPVTLFGSDEQKGALLPGVVDGRCITAFALSEPDAGSDVAALATTAERRGDGSYALNGVKTWISNGGIADSYVVFARTGDAPGHRGLSAFLVDAQNPGLRVGERIATVSPHPLATISLEDCRVAASQLIGASGSGFRVAMATLDVFRATVGAAALGMARRALAETRQHAANRTMFGALLGDLPLAQATIADMAVDIDAAALLVYRAAWTKDNGAPRITLESAMAKLFATEAAQRVVDSAVQLHGGLGVTSGHPVETLYRAVRALRIYEGASEIQRLVIARSVLAGSA